MVCLSVGLVPWQDAKDQNRAVWVESKADPQIPRAEAELGAEGALEPFDLAFMGLREAHDHAYDTALVHRVEPPEILFCGVGPAHC